MSYEVHQSSLKFTFFSESSAVGVRAVLVLHKNKTSSLRPRELLEFTGLHWCFHLPRFTEVLGDALFYESTKTVGTFVITSVAIY